VMVGSKALTSGGQLAELITMVIYARGINLGVKEPNPESCIQRCCVKKGSDPARTQLDHVPISESCSEDGWVNAFEEIGEPAPLSPFERRSFGRMDKD
jgi:hypothetical protein